MPTARLSSSKKSLVNSQCRYALERALGYIAENSRPKIGGWSDFRTNRSGESTSWVTGYVLFQLGNLLPAAVVKAGLEALLNQKQPTGAWGFSEVVPPDCDSTLHVLQALHSLGGSKIDLLEPIQFALSHQLEGGGFSTYREDSSLKRYRGSADENYEGWLQPHICVTAVALQTLRYSPGFRTKQLDNAVDFLLLNQNPDGYWESYWWRSKYFATTRIIEQFSSLGVRRVEGAKAKGLGWIISSASPAGYWSNGYDSEVACPLSTAYSINALLAADKSFALVTKGVRWILEQQCEDGSWKGRPTLQIPPPHIKSSEQVSSWVMGGRGVGSCCLDEGRIYTTATMAAALQRFIERTQKWDLARLT